MDISEHQTKKQTILVLPGGTRRTMRTIRTTVLFAKGKSDRERKNKQDAPNILFMSIFIKAFETHCRHYISRMEYVTVNIEET